MSKPTLKPIRSVHRSTEPHWVGDGFPVRTLFSYRELGESLSPFLLLDYAGPREFPPTERRLGVGPHPHRGFETVTIVYEGEVEHRDSSGGGGKIGRGDVQWMTAAAGIVHEEFHGREFARQGGRFEMVQLWVNLPAKDKAAPPRYQGILDEQIPAVSLGEGQGTLRVIAGRYGGATGPAETFTPIHVWDLRLDGDRASDLPVPDGQSTALVVLRGSVRVNDERVLEAAQVAVFERDGDAVRLDDGADARALLLSGEPIEEPIVGHGPFVMNTPDEIHQAIADFQEGRMGRL